MKSFLLPVLSLLVFSASAQKTEARLDATYKPTTDTPAYISYTEVKDGLYWKEIFFYPGNVIHQRTQSKDAEGKLMVGTGVKYYKSGKVSDSLLGDGQGGGHQMQFYENGVKAMEGDWVDDVNKHNTWKFYNEQGQLIATEENDHGKVKSVTCLGPTGKPLPAGSCVSHEATYPGDVAAWRAFLGSNLNADVPIKKKAPAGVYNVIVQFVVSKNGRVTDVTALTNFGYGMEQEAVRVIKHSPSWNAAVFYGQPVNAYRKQPITFQVTEEKTKK